MRFFAFCLITLTTTAAWGETLRGTVTSLAAQTAEAPLGYWRIENRHLPIAAPRLGERVLVVLEPLEPATAVKPPPKRIVIEARDRALLPRLVYAPMGSTFEIHNLDAMPRIIYLQDDAKLLPRDPTLPGRSREFTLDAAGTYQLLDAAYPYAQTIVLITTAPYVTSVDEEGRFTIEAPAGRYHVKAFNGAWSPTLTVEVGKTGEVTLRLPPPQSRGAQ